MATEAFVNVSTSFAIYNLRARKELLKPFPLAKKTAVDITPKLCSFMLYHSYFSKLNYQTEQQ